MLIAGPSSSACLWRPLGGLPPDEVEHGTERIGTAARCSQLAARRPPLLGRSTELRMICELREPSRDSAGCDRPAVYTSARAIAAPATCTAVMNAEFKTYISIAVAADTSQPPHRPPVK